MENPANLPPQHHEGSDSDLPEQVGAYRRLERLADGGFGVVYRAERADDGSPAAIKVVHADLASNAMVVQRFEREIEAVRRIDHPGVARVLEQGRLPDGRPYFAMELVAGEDLGAHLKARGRLPLGETLAIFEELCAVLAAAHARSIIHRDVKASNVMLAAEGARRRVVLLDFGVAKLLDDQGPKLTGSRHIVGTLSCMSPEQILGGAVDERTDVYALGLLAYRALTGEPPFAARSALAMHQMHLTAVPRAPSSLAALPPALDGVLLRALAKERDARQPGAAAFFEELRAAAESAGGRRPAERRVVAVLIEVLVEPAALDDPEDDLLSDMEAILPGAADELAPLGLRVAMETGTTLLLAAERPADDGADLRLRRSLLLAVSGLHRRLRARRGAHPAAGVRACVHTGELALDQDGTAVGGALLQLDAWLPDGDTAGALASRSVLAGLSLQAAPLGETGGEWAALGE